MISAQRLMLASVRVLSVLTLLPLALYFFLAVLPYYANGLHGQPVSAIDEGQFNPLFFPPFAGTGIGWYRYELALTSVGLILFVVPLVVAIQGVIMWRVWPAITRYEKTYAVLIFTAAILTIIFALSSMGMSVLSWLEID